MSRVKSHWQPHGGSENSLLAYGFGKAARLAQAHVRAQWWAQAWTRQRGSHSDAPLGTFDPTWSELEGWLERCKKAVLKSSWPRAISPSSVPRGLVRLLRPPPNLPLPALLTISEHPSIAEAAAQLSPVAYIYLVRQIS